MCDICDQIETQGVDVSDPGVNAATLDSMLRRLQLGDTRAAALSLGVSPEEITAWRTGSEPVSKAAMSRIGELVDFHSELANNIAEAVLGENVQGPSSVVMERFVDEAQYKHVGGVHISVDGAEPKLVPFQVHLAAVLTAADIIATAGHEVVYKYLDETRAERMRAMRYTGVEPEQAFTTH